MRIDSHHHLWHYSPQEYGWIDDHMKVLRSDFGIAELTEACSAAGISGTVAVQARQSWAETDWLLSPASESQIIRGVVGWAPIASPTFSHELAPRLENPLLKGLRHVVQDEPDGFLDSAEFNRGISALQGTGLLYDILIFARQLKQAISFVDRHPKQVFVLDHLGKPDIAAGAFEAWASGFRELAQRDNIVCKLSGMVTEADWTAWTPDTLRPYFETALEAFGPERLMAGSDWPVLRLACEYGRWWQIVSGWIAPLSPAERAAIEGETAIRTYRLEVPRAGAV